MLEDLSMQASKQGASKQWDKEGALSIETPLMRLCCDRTCIGSKRDEKFGTIGLARHAPSFIAPVLEPPIYCHCFWFYCDVVKVQRLQT